MHESISRLEKSPDSSIQCQAYIELFNLRAKDDKRWANILYMVGLAAGLALVTAIVLAVLGKNGQAAASAVGTIVTGVAAVWIRTIKEQARKESAEFLDKAKEFCTGDDKQRLETMVKR